MRYVRPRLEFVPQRLSLGVVRASHWVLPFLLRVRTRPWLPAGITRVEAVNAEGLVKLYQRFQAGEIRFLMAFRHPEVDDPMSLMYLFSRILPGVARRQKIALKLPLHTHFLYDRGMPLWAGNWLEWLFSRLGGMPIHRGRALDWTAIRAARELFANGSLPITIAPEGATNGHSEIVSPLEPGVAQLGFWCVDDLRRAHRSQEVLIVPIGVQYRYPKPPWAQLDRLMGRLEADCGLPPAPPFDPRARDGFEEALYARLLRLAERLLDTMEQFYRRLNHRPLEELSPKIADLTGEPHPQLAWRLQALLDVALRTAEQHFGISSTGGIAERCRRLEEAGWIDTYREDLPESGRLSRLEQGLADWVAQAAILPVKQMRLVESFVAVTGSYVRDRPTAERFAETTLILFDLVSRIKGEKNPRRPRLGWRQARISIGEPISVTERWSAYHTSRSAARQSVQRLTGDLQQALEKLID
ncbi:1-acyl-sn-glycerol-3-phosphate acyltransferase [Gloeobacter morelensis]|uniref:1-acyl-sn-glycerol-3-phosphate acyltransferase n=1 Tax=Gloeobacter morelensis MG652769 TaxID=2781736 RepID=A0ABY3PL71_9CYAN|nr:1-acyl-sn-glycerol-3-phosphate acyltransferase [Gloeobacter morelensis]UFP94442.1 1-acyl-sn-glycerol-3-phosphate acyltransferase [Gloeobacter morelensis MG652769]